MLFLAMHKNSRVKSDNDLISVSLEKMTDEELDEAIAKEYGEDWDPANFEKGDPLADEFFRRIGIAGD